MYFSDSIVRVLNEMASAEMPHEPTCAVCQRGREKKRKKSDEKKKNLFVDAA
jgi:hypothetical protein